MSLDVTRAVEAVWRIEGARIVAALAKTTGDFGLAEDVAQEGAGLLAGGGLEVHPLEKVGVAGKELHPRLGGAARERDGRLHPGPVGDLHDVGDAAIARQHLRVKVQERDAVAVDARLDVHGEIATGGVAGRHGRQPLARRRLVHLHAEPGRRLDDPGDLFGRR